MIINIFGPPRAIVGGQPLPKPQQPPMGRPGQLLMSLIPDLAFEPVAAVTAAADGWLVNRSGDLLIEGIV